MKIIKRKNLYYLGHSFRKEGKVTYREKYIGKEVPENIEDIKETFLRQCLQESVFAKLKEIKVNFRKEWKRYPESMKKKVLLDIAIKFTYNTNAIEGSTITLDETEELIKRRISPHKSLQDVQETICHSKVFFNVLNERKELSLNMLLQWHKDIFIESKPDIAGRLRDYMVRVGDYRAPDWQDVEVLIKKFILWFNKNKLLNPVELASRAHYKFEKIHPFGDGNGRVGRLLIAFILKIGKYPILTIDYKKRKSYYHALTKSENEFVQYFLRRYIKTFKKYV